MSNTQQPLGSGFSAISTTDDVLKGVDLTGKRAVITGAVYTILMSLHVRAAILIAMFVALAAGFLPLLLSGKQWRAAEERARARRMAEHRMNARLLRLNI